MLTRAVLVALLVSLSACGLGTSSAGDKEPVLLVEVEERTIGSWIERESKYEISDPDEALRAVRALSVAMRLDRSTIRDNAWKSLQQIADTHDSVLPELAPLLDIASHSSRIGNWLSDCGERIEPAIPALVDALGSPNGDARAGARTALRNAFRIAEPDLEAALTDSNLKRRVGAAGLLSRYAGKQQLSDGAQQRLAPVVVGILLECLGDDDELVRRGAAPCVGAWGPDAAFAVPQLLAAFEGEPDVYTRMYLLQSAYKTSDVPSAAFPQLLAIVSDENEDGGVVANAVICLREIRDIGPQGEVAATAAIAALGEPSAARRVGGARVLSAVGTNANGAVDALVAALDANDEGVVREVVVALYHLGPDASAAAIRLRELRQNCGPELSETIGYALQAIEQP